MYLHLGQKTVIPFRCIVGVFDLDNTSTSKHTRRYLDAAQKNGRVISVSDELPRSFIVCEERGEQMVYISQISAQTLLKRAEEALSAPI